MKGLIFVCVVTSVAITFVPQVTPQNYGNFSDSTRCIYLDDVIPDVQVILKSPLQYTDYVFNLTDQFRNNTGRAYKVSLLLYSKTDNFTGVIDIQKISGNGSSVHSFTWTSKTEIQTEIEGALEIRVKVSNLTSGSASLVATVYFDTKTYGCPSPDFISCNSNHKCSSSESSEETYTDRCIFKDSAANGRQHCGNLTECEYNDGDHTYGDDLDIGWYDVQYLLTILLAGLFFILSPICIVIFLFYHRRINAARNVEIERRRAVQGLQRNGHEAGSVGGYTVSPRDDMPPSYEDVHDTKSPPPSFDSVLVTTDRRSVDVSNINNSSAQ